MTFITLQVCSLARVSFLALSILSAGMVDGDKGIPSSRGHLGTVQPQCNSEQPQGCPKLCQFVTMPCGCYTS